MHFIFRSGSFEESTHLFFFERPVNDYLFKSLRVEENHFPVQSPHTEHGSQPVDDGTHELSNRRIKSVLVSHLLRTDVYCGEFLLLGVYEDAKLVGWEVKEEVGLDLGDHVWGFEVGARVGEQVVEDQGFFGEHQEHGAVVQERNVVHRPALYGHLVVNPLAQQVEPPNLDVIVRVDGHHPIPARAQVNLHQRVFRTH